MTVDGDMFCRAGFQAEGEFGLPGAHIGGQLELSSAKLANPGGTVLNATKMTVDDDMICREKFQAEGEIRLLGAHISGQLNLNSAKLANPGGAVLIADGMTVDGDMFCAMGFQADGEIRLLGAHIGGQLAFRGASLSNAPGLALDCEDLEAGSLFLDDTKVAGTVDLTSAQVRVLYDNPKRWPPRMRIDRFTYQSLQPYAEARGKSGRLTWLDRAEPEYLAQPYEQLAAYYRRLGHDEEARRVLLAKQRRRRSTLGPIGKTTGYLLDGIVGYGYRPGRAFAWLVALLVAGSVYFTYNRPAPLDPAQHPHYQPVLYTADQLIPLVNLSQANVWAPGRDQPVDHLRPSGPGLGPGNRDRRRSNPRAGPGVARELPGAHGAASLLPPAGPQAQGWTGKCKSGHCQGLAEVGIHPLAIGQDRS